MDRSPSRTELVLRVPHPGDGAGLSALWSAGARYYAELFPHDFQVPMDQGLALWFESGLCREPSRSDLRTMLAERMGLIVGLAVGTLTPPMPTSSHQWNPSLAQIRLHVDALVIHPDHWRKGIGGSLVKDLEAWARGKGATEAFTDTYHDSPVSIPFWQERMHYRPRSVVMVKRLR